MAARGLWRGVSVRRNRFGHRDAPSANIRQKTRVTESEISQAKSRMRADAMARRDALPADLRAAAAETIAARPFPVGVAPGMVVSGFFPMKSEINPIPLMKALAAAGVQLGLPVIAGRGRPLMMRAWSFGDPLESRQWGIREPLDAAPEVAPDIVLAPLLAFDRGGNRIGYGAGYYDMTVAALRARKPVVAIGLAFAAQEVPAVPHGGGDERLDLVLTEREIIDCRGA
jgi:5-formyltetrahydrofolate cyclo-ligase